MDAADLPDAPAKAIASFWGTIGSLVRAGHIDPKLLWNGNGGDCSVWWATLAPRTRRERTEQSGPTIFEHFEWLAGIMNELDRRAGGVPVDMAWVAANMERRIAMFQDLIRVRQSLRTVIIASPETVPVAPPASHAAAQG